MASSMVTRRLMKESAAFMAVLSVTIVGCNRVKAKGTANGDPNAAGSGGVTDVTTTVDPNSGQVVASVSADAKATQLVKVPDSSPVKGTSLSIPPGTLSVSTSVAIEPAAPLVNSGNTAALGLSANVVAVGVPVSIQPTSGTVEALQPFTVALALPTTSGASLVDATANLYVIYKTTDAAKGTYVLGLIPRSRLAVTGTALSFTTRFFGAFQAVIGSGPVTTPVEVAVASSPILTAAQARALPAISVTSRTPFVVSAGQTITITGKNFRPTMMLALGGTPVKNLKVASDTSASFSAPAYQGFGLTNLTTDQDGAATQAGVVYYTSTFTDRPVSTLKPSSVCAGVQFYDGNGTLQTGTLNCTIPPNCTADGATGCVTTSTYPSALATGLAAKVLAGNTVAGVTGAIANCAADGATGCLAVTGYAAASTCTADGQQNCTVTGVFKAANVTGIGAWDLRVGLTLGGIVGAMKTNCRNAVSSTYFNYDGALASLPNSGVTSGTQNDYWDTMDDNWGFSTSRVTGWSSNTLCDSSNWTDVTTINGGASNVACGTSSTCIYQDNVTKLQITGVISGSSPWNTTNTASPATFNWNAGVQACAGSTYGGYAAGTWRLPTQKEAYALYEHGIASLASSNFATSSNLNSAYWTASTVGTTTSQAWYVNYAGGTMWGGAKTTTDYLICVR